MRTDCLSAERFPAEHDAVWRALEKSGTGYSGCTGSDPFVSQRLCVSNSLSGSDRKLDEVPAVGDPPHIA